MKGKEGFDSYFGKSTILDALLRVAILGTDRAQLEKQVSARLYELGFVLTDNEGSGASNILSVMSGWQVYARAGGILPKYSEALPSKCELDVNIMPDAARPFLKEILKGRFKPVLSEFLYFLIKKGMVVSLEMLPDLFDAVKDNKKLHPFISRVSGNRGKWLGSRVSDWRNFFPSLLEESEVPKEKRFFFEHYRLQQPDEARDWLESGWSSFKGQMRMELMKGMEKGCGIGDITFLEQCLEGEKLGIRRIGASLLMQLPESGLYKKINKLFQILEIANPLVFREKLEYFKSLSALKQKDFIDFPFWKDSGQTSGIDQAVYTMCRFFPLTSWGLADKRSISAVVGIYVNRKEVSVLRGIMHNPSLRYAIDWQEVLLETYSRNPEKAMWGIDTEDYLIKAISKDVYCRVAAEILRVSDTVPIVGNREHFILSAFKYGWNRELSAVFVEYAVKDLKKTTFFEGGKMGVVNYNDMKALCVHVSCFFHPGLLKAAEQCWESAAGRHIFGDLESFYETVEFRRDMVLSIYGN